MVFSLLRRLAGLEKPSQDNVEYINPTISIWPSLITSETTLVGITTNSTLGTEKAVKRCHRAELTEFSVSPTKTTAKHSQCRNARSLICGYTGL
jgi:hypothetical protein